MSNKTGGVPALARAIFGRDKYEAIAKGECVRCYKPAAVTQWKAIDVAEYRISGICPDCWDDLFPEEEGGG